METPIGIGSKQLLTLLGGIEVEYELGEYDRAAERS